MNTVALICVRIEAADAAHLILADWPLLQELVVSYQYVKEVAYEVLGVQNVGYQLHRLETDIMLHQRVGTWFFPRRSNTAWPELTHLSVTITRPAYRDKPWSGWCGQAF